MSVLPFRRTAPVYPAEPTEEPHMTGEAVCLSCSRKWQAVLPVGSRTNLPEGTENELGLECPGCHSFKGVLTRFVLYEDVKLWHCSHCSGMLYALILAKGDVPCVSCATCGNLTNALDLFNK